jgi:hypothetical protein
VTEKGDLADEKGPINVFEETTGNQSEEGYKTEEGASNRRQATDREEAGVAHGQKDDRREAQTNQENRRAQAGQEEHSRRQTQTESATSSQAPGRDQAKARHDARCPSAEGPAGRRAGGPCQ